MVFQKGQCANPHGRPPDSTAMTKLKAYTKTELANQLSLMFRMTGFELEKIYRDDTQPAMVQAIAKALIRAKRDGDFSAVERLLDRCIGKVPQKIEGEGFGFMAPPITNITYIGVPAKGLPPNIKAKEIDVTAEQLPNP